MNLRKTDYIDRQVQGTLACRLAIHWFLFLASAIVLVFCMQWIHAPFRPLGDQVGLAWERHGIIFIMLICLVPIFVYDSVRLSNRFTGPMLRFRRAAHDLAEGNTPEKIRLRNNDFWQDVATDFNRVIERQENSGSVSS